MENPPLVESANAIEKINKISAMLRGEYASQPMMVQSTPIENNLCNF